MKSSHDCLKIWGDSHWTFTHSWSNVGIISKMTAIARVFADKRSFAPENFLRELESWTPVSLMLIAGARGQRLHYLVWTREQNFSQLGVLFKRDYFPDFQSSCLLVTLRQSHWGKSHMGARIISLRINLSFSLFFGNLGNHPLTRFHTSSDDL